MRFPTTALISDFFPRLDFLRLPFRWKKQSYTLRPTRYGIIFLLMLTALFIGSVNHNNNFGYLLTFLLGSVVLVSLTHTFANLKEIFISPVPVKPVFAGQMAEIGLLLHCKTTRRIGINVCMQSCSGMPIDLFDNVSATITIALPTTERGVIKEKSVTVKTDFPLGLMEMQTTVPVSISCLVYPAPIPGPLIASAAGTEQGDGAPAAARGDTDFSELSPYRIGDDLRRAHWKSLAAGKDLHTIKFEEAPTVGTMFSLASMPGKDLETKLGLLCSMVLTAESQHLEYGLILGNKVTARASGVTHKNACLEALALY
jgi:uncharacterized protein (DUF58 family)